MSSRSLAAARARRSAESAPPVSGNRPITSIGSQAAFAQQQPPYASNVRTAKAMPPSSQRYTPQQQQQQPQQQFYDAPQTSSNGLPFTKISISDAIGLITLRLGRVEQWVIETEHEQQVNESNTPSSSSNVDGSVINTLLSRIETLEKREPGVPGVVDDELVKSLSEEVKTLKEQLTRIGDDVIKHTLELSKNTEQVFRFNRELTETKDILKSFMVKYDLFAQETTQNFADYELALGDLEKRLPSVAGGEENDASDAVEDDIVSGTSISDLYANDNVIMSTDLKSIIKQELGAN